MGFSSIPGSEDTQAGQIIPGFVGVASPPPPPPPPDPACQSPTYREPVMPIRQVRFAMISAELKLALQFPRIAPVGADESVTQVNSYFVPYAHGPRTDGPFAARLPIFTVPDVYQANPEPAPPDNVYPPFVPAITITDMRSPFPFRPVFTPPAANPPALVSPPPPLVPPPPPPPELGVLGPSRQEVPSIPRAPAAEDPRVRPHIDKVATLLNDLLRRGYIRQVGRDDFEIVGGGFGLSRDPVATDDKTVGAVVGCNFVNITTQDVFVCVNNSVGSAVWKKVS